MERILKLIENYGLTLIAVILLVAWLRPKADEAWRVLMERASYFPPQPKLDPEETERKFEIANIADDQIMAILRAVQTEFRSSRAYVFQYHNGGFNMAGGSFSRVSLTHEVVALGVQRQQQWLQRMPRTLVHAFTKMIDSGLGVFCPCIELCFMETDASTYETLRQQGIVSVYCGGLFSDRRFPMGFLGVDYCEGKVEFTDSQMDKLKIFAERIATIICMSGCNSVCSKPFRNDGEKEINGLVKN
jgi:hypothetical protein